MKLNSKGQVTIPAELRRRYGFDEGLAVLNPLVYAEVSVGFDRIEDLDEVFPATTFRREPLPYPAGFFAGKAFLAYRRSGWLPVAHR